MGYKQHNSKLSSSLHSRESSNMHKRSEDLSNSRHIVLWGNLGNSLGKGQSSSRNSLQKQQEHGC